MARLISLLIAGLISNSAFAAELSKTRLEGEFIDINAETSELKFRSSVESADASFITTQDVICFETVAFLNGICIKKEISRGAGNSRPRASVRVSNAPKDTAVTITCGESSRLRLTPTLEFDELANCRLSYDIPVVIQSYFGGIMINGGVSVTFLSQAVAIRFAGDFGLCKTNDLDACQKGWLFQNQEDLATVQHDQQIVGIFKVGRTTRR